jgi:pimeloyl-ACP methyl ester carboxylesterase
VYGKSGHVIDSIGLICRPFPDYIPPSGVPILLVHGINNSAQEQDEYHTNCEKYFESFISGFANERRSLVTIGYYAGDVDCDLYINGYQSVTNNTSISDIASAFADLVEEHFHDNNVSRVQVAAHSMGGLITRDAIARHGSDLDISEVATFGTPHNGASKADLCTTVPWTNSHQCEEMKEGSDFLDSLDEDPNPQAANGTRWMLVGSEDDEATGPDTTVAMGSGPDTRPEVRIEYYEETAFVGNSCSDDKNKVGHSEIISSEQIGTCANGQYEGIKTPVDHAIDFF